ncbi:MAG: hypothetical protein LBM92_00910 [Opitutaceae bacterium]|nr:hypothetical protein [Opitutaceae bacterium]
MAPPPVRAQPATGASSVTVRLHPVKDEIYGTVGRRRVAVAGFEERLISDLQALGDAGTNIKVERVSDNNEPAANEGRISVSVAKAYIHQVADSQSAVVVLKLEHAGKASYFRGQKTGIIWIGHDEEFKAAFEKSLGMALAQMRPALLAAAKAGKE